MSISNRSNLAWLVGGAAICFLIGWLVGRSGMEAPRKTDIIPAPSTYPAPQPTATAPIPSSTGAQLLLGEGGIQLLPDASLHLDPIESPDIAPP